MIHGNGAGQTPYFEDTKPEHESALPALVRLRSNEITHVSKDTNCPIQTADHLIIF